MSRYGQKEKYSFTLEDVHQWYEGSSDAEKKIWFDSNFYSLLVKYIVKMTEKRKIDFDDRESIASEIAVEIISKKRGLKRKNELNDVDHFKRKMKATAKGLLINSLDKINKYKHISIDEQNIDTYKNYIDRTLNHVTPLDEVISKENQQISLELLNEFKNCKVLKKRSALYEHLCILIKLYTNDEEAKYQKKSINTNTWNSNNKRLRIEFKKFIQSKQEYINIFEE